MAIYSSSSDNLGFLLTAWGTLLSHLGIGGKFSPKLSPLVNSSRRTDVAWL